VWYRNSWRYKERGQIGIYHKAPAKRGRGEKEKKEERGRTDRSRHCFEKGGKTTFFYNEALAESQSRRKGGGKKITSAFLFQKKKKKRRNDQTPRRQKKEPRPFSRCLKKKKKRENHRADQATTSTGKKKGGKDREAPRGPFPMVGEGGRERGGKIPSSEEKEVIWRGKGKTTVMGRREGGASKMPS